MSTQADTNYNEACRAYEEKDYDTAYELFYALALESDVSCQMNVANMLMYGLGVEKNEDRAYEWYEQAALNEDKEAQYIHAWHSLQKDEDEEGLKYLNLSAEAEFLDAMYDLAGLHVQALYGCEQDYAKANSLYEKSISLGKKEALGALFASKKQELGRVKAFMYMMKNISKLTKRVK